MFTQITSLKVTFFILFSLTLLFTSCEKKEKIEPNTNITTTTGSNDDEYHFGLLDNENHEAVESDLYLASFGGDPPSSVDFSDKMPPVKSQGDFGTCVSWSVGYYTRTAMHAITHEMSSADLAQENNQCSPKDLHYAIPPEYKPSGCTNGTWINSALDQLLERGVADMDLVPYADLDEYACQDGSNQWGSAASGNKIERYRSIELDREVIKSHLANYQPVMFGAKAYESLGQLRSLDNNYVANSTDLTSGTFRGGHAMTICGYDDSKGQNGAFKIINSWGTNWGNNGFLWVDYNAFFNNFIKYAYVAYGQTVDPEEPDTPTSTSTNLAAGPIYDVDNANTNAPLERQLIFNVHNIGENTVSPAERWSVIYMYYNAYDAQDYGVLLHQNITNEFGASGENGPYNQGIGSSGNWWYNVSMPSQSNLAQRIFNQSTDNIYWNFTMPPITGDYYLLVYVDPFETITESNETDNFQYITNQSGGPIRFENGIGFGFQSPEQANNRSSDHNPHTAVNDLNKNAYTPEEIRKFIRLQKEQGLLPEPTNRIHQNNVPSNR